MENRKESNLVRLIEASPFKNQLSDEIFDALLDYYMLFEDPLSIINVDNDISNRMVQCTVDELKDKYVFLNLNKYDCLYYNEEDNLVAFFIN